MLSRRTLVVSLCAALAAVPALGGPVQQEAPSYHELITSGQSGSHSPQGLRSLERHAYERFKEPEWQRRLALAFGETTERVWAVVHGEVSCNIADDEDQRTEMGARIFRWLAGAVTSDGEGTVGVSLSKYVEVSESDPIPVETHFEVSYLVGMSMSAQGAEGAPTLDLAAMSEIRRHQLDLWYEKDLRLTALHRWQRTIADAGHWTAYNYWLFGGALEGEFRAWRSSHGPEWRAWLGWKASRQMNLRKPDFHRIHELGRVTFLVSTGMEETGEKGSSDGPAPGHVSGRPTQLTPGGESGTRSDDGRVSVPFATGPAWDCETRVVAFPDSDRSASFVQCRPTDASQLLFLMAKTYTVPPEDKTSADELARRIYPQSHAKRFSTAEVERVEKSTLGGHEAADLWVKAIHERAGPIRSHERVAVEGTRVFVLSAEGSPAAFEAASRDRKRWFAEASFADLAPAGSR